MHVVTYVTSESIRSTSFLSLLWSFVCTNGYALSLSNKYDKYEIPDSSVALHEYS